MPVSKIQHQIFNQSPKNQVMHLKEGQIVEGKIIQLYGDDHAKVRIGSTTLIAQIETALSVGGSYYFQVSETNDQIYLQVVQSDGKNNVANIETLLAQLQIRGTKFNQQLVEGLISGGIPFNRTQLEQAIQILQEAPNKTRAIETLNQMFQTKMPITEHTFQALSTFSAHQFTPLLESVSKALQQTAIPLRENEAALLQLINQFIDRPETMDVKQTRIVLEQIKQNPQALTMYQMLGLLDSNTDQEEVVRRLENYVQTRDISQFPLQHVKRKEQLQQVMQNTNMEVRSLLQHEQTVNRTALKLMSIYHPIQTTSLTEQDLGSLMKMVEKELMPLLSDQVKHQVMEMLQRVTVQDQTPLLHLLHALADKSLFQSLTHVEDLIQQLEAPKPNQAPVQQHLLAQLSRYMESIGLTMEHDVIQALQTAQIDGQETITQTQTIKSMLLQMLQHGGQQNEQIQQLVHFINGLQLQTITETNQMLQAQLVIPGNPFALNEDIFMKFESKKTADDQIDADFCRIIFMLNLESLQETIVDMQVQKRIITVTIFNDVETKVDKMQTLRSVMKANLEQLDYQLSTVDWKPLSENKAEQPQNSVQSISSKQQEGFDFRI